MLLANYGNGKSAVVFPIHDDGGLSPISSAVQHTGSGPDAVRQDRSHAHCIVPDPSNRYVVVADLGIDQLVRYPLDLGAFALHREAAVPFALPSGSGPHRLVFHPSGNYLIDAGTARMEYVGYQSTQARTPRSFAIDPTGLFLLVVNQDRVTVVTFRIDPQSGLLRETRQIPYTPTPACLKFAQYQNGRVE